MKSSIAARLWTVFGLSALLLGSVGSASAASLNKLDVSYGSFQVVPVSGSKIVSTVAGTTNAHDVTVNRTSGTDEFRQRTLD